MAIGGWKKGFVGMLLGVAISTSSCVSRQYECPQLPQHQEQGNAGCLVVHDGKLLMVQQRLTGAWSLPGGTAESNERAVCTASRETEEETGYRVKVLRQLHRFYNGFRLYLCEVDAQTTPNVGDNLEISQAAWLDLVERNEVSWRFEDQRELIQRLVEQVTAEPLLK